MGIRRFGSDLGIDARILATYEKKEPGFELEAGLS